MWSDFLNFEKNENVRYLLYNTYTCISFIKYLNIKTCCKNNNPEKPQH